MREAIKVKNRLYRTSIKNKTSEDSKKYRKYKSRLGKIIKKEERKFYAAKIELYKNDLRKSWGVIKSVINKMKGTNKINAKFKINGQVVTDKEKISNQFNESFTNVGTNLDKKIPKSRIDPISYIKKDYVIDIVVEPCETIELKRIRSEERR